MTYLIRVILFTYKEDVEWGLNFAHKLVKTKLNNKTNTVEKSSGNLQFKIIIRIQ